MLSKEKHPRAPGCRSGFQFLRRQRYLPLKMLGSYGGGSRMWQSSRRFWFGAPPYVFQVGLLIDLLCQRCWQRYVGLGKAWSGTDGSNVTGTPYLILWMVLIVHILSKKVE